MASWIVRVLSLAAVNVVTGKLALLLAIPPGYATALWPPSGIALGAVLLWGYRILPGVLLGSILININVWNEDFLTSALVAVGIALGSTAQAALGAFLIRRFIGFPSLLVRSRDVFLFFAFGGPSACLFASACAVVVLWMAGAIPTANIPFSWWTWWVGDSIGVLIFTPLVLIAFCEPRSVWARRKTTVAIPLLVATSGVTVLFAYASIREKERQRLEFSERSAHLVDELMNQIHGYNEVVWSIVRFFESSEEVTRPEFYQFTEPTIRRLRGIRGFSWNPKVPASGLEHFENRIRGEGFSDYAVIERDPNGSPISVKPRSEYFPVAYIVPLEGNEEALGFDIASEPMRKETLERALMQNNAVATGCIELVQETDGRCDMLIVAPVFTSTKSFMTEKDRRLYLRGYAVGVFNIDEMVDDAVAMSSPNSSGLRVQVQDTTVPGSERELYSGRWFASAADKSSMLALDSVQTIGGRQWALHVYATQEYMVQHLSWQSWMVGAVGLAFAAVLGAFLLILDGRAAELEAINVKLQEAVKARDEFLSIASHELRTPLTPLKLQLQSALRLLAREGAPAPVQERLLKSFRVIDGQVERLGRLVDDLLDTSRISAGRLVLERQTIDLRQVVTEVLERHRKELQTTATVPRLHAPKPVVGQFDRLRMEQVVTNLLTNVIKYAPGKTVHISLFATRGRATLMVRDEGPGIAPEDLVRIFERFERAVIPGYQGGLGLGLFIVRQIVEAHGGTVFAESSIGHGAKFIVEIPLSPGNGRS